MTRISLLLALVCAALVLVVPATTGAATITLKAVVGPGTNITLTKGGKKVTTLKAGKYSIVVSDKSAIHNFHLRGPGVNKLTTVPSVGSKTWKVTLKKGKYTFVCDPHASTMKGSFTVK